MLLSLVLLGTACGSTTTDGTRATAQETSNAPSSDGPTTTTPRRGTPAPASISKDLASVPLPAIVAATTAGTSVNPLKPISDGTLRTKDGKPEVLYIGGEFCPYCAGERWPLTVALSKFGTFSDLHLIHSAESNVPTLTYVGSTYTSPYVTFTPVEMKGNEPSGNGWADLQTATDEQRKLLNGRGQGSFPFIDFGGMAVQSGGSVDMSTLIGKSQADIASTLAASTTKDTDQATIQGNVNLVAGQFIRMICELTGDQPADVCSAFPAPTPAPA
ncbi:MAG TPA: DUF929 family protein [Acidimicrobiales bacterium]|nr:DUF929 family protein [Acidimicrobiales bacterium]